MQIPVYNLTGEIVEHIEVSDHIFAAPVNEGVMHQAMVRQQANARQGTASTKTRSEVAGSGRKLFRQKGTGFARAGDRGSPIRRGGGIAFGPKPRDYSQALPKKMRRLALKGALSAKVRDKELMVLEKLDFEEPKTKKMAQILTALGVASSALVVTHEPQGAMIKSARNLPGIKTTPANLLNVLDILSYKMLLMTVAAVRKAEQLWGEKAAQEVDNASL